MREIDITQLGGEEVRLYLPLTKQSDVIFRLGGNIIGCVDSQTDEHFDYETVGTFFDAETFYSSDYLQNIHWVDCGMFNVETAYLGGLKLVNEDGQEYVIKKNIPESEFGRTTMEEVKTFEINSFKNSLT